MTWICRECGVKLSGSKVEHCTACHRTFAGTGAGDAHRYGPPSKRRCRSRANMLKRGMTVTLNAYGAEIWHLPASPDAPWLVQGRESETLTAPGQGESLTLAPETV